MDADKIKYRRCLVRDCDYKELRGSRQGDFANGSFVCPAHFNQIKALAAIAKTALGQEAMVDPSYYPELRGFLA